MFHRCQNIFGIGVIGLGLFLLPNRQLLFAQQTALESPRSSDSQLAERGIDLILNQRYLPPDFDQETFDQVWKSWDGKLGKLAARATPAERRRMAFARYGMTPRKNDPGKPMQFVVDQKGQWSMNCFTCHGGSLYDSPDCWPGLPNNRVALETLYEDMRKTKRIIGKPFSQMDIGSALVPMGSTVGTSNAVIFGVSLMAFRDKNINLKSFVIPPLVQHHDMDAPPWWNYKHKKMLYIDGFTAKHHRALMPFMMVKENDGPRFRSFEQDFVAIQKFIERVPPPRFPGKIDQGQAAIGKVLFEDNCAQCHGSYKDLATHKGDFQYPEVTISMDEIETDPVRQTALSPSYRKRYGESWLADYGKARTLTRPQGYVAPPLIGIWASAPYFHNGSVPTLRGVLAPEERPEIWIRHQSKLNEKDLGLTFRSVDAVPAGLSSANRRLYFDTRKFGKSNSGHEFGKHLSRAQQSQLLEYLKTL